MSSNEKEQWNSLVMSPFAQLPYLPEGEYNTVVSVSLRATGLPHCLRPN